MQLVRKDNSLQGLGCTEVSPHRILHCSVATVTISSSSSSVTTVTTSIVSISHSYIIVINKAVCHQQGGVSSARWCAPTPHTTVTTTIATTTFIVVSISIISSPRDGLMKMRRSVWRSKAGRHLVLILMVTLGQESKSLVKPDSYSLM